MKLHKHFEKFNSQITLNPTRQNRINSAYTAWNDNFKEHEDLREIFEEFYQQGSYSTDTAIKPQSSNEFDIDSVLLLNLEGDEKPKETLQQIRDVIESFEKYKGKTKIKDRCVRIDYAQDFHFDVVPAKPSNGKHIIIPCKTEDEWQETNPAGFTKWFNNKNSKASKIKPLVRIIKYWRDLKVGKDAAPKSILLSTLIANNIKTCNSTAESLVMTLDNLITNMDSILDNNEQPFVENPSLAGENLARDWDKPKFDIFKAKLKKLLEDSRVALNEKDEEESILQWRSIFGTKFPETLPEEETAKAIKTGQILVSSSGTLNYIEGKSIPQHRFYGDIPNGRK